jgi:hypothetical protein
MEAAANVTAVACLIVSVFMFSCATKKLGNGEIKVMGIR